MRSEDRQLWKQAEEHARRRRLSMSALVMTALEAYLAEHDKPKGGEPPTS